MTTRVALTLAGVLVATPLTAQPSALDKLQHNQIPAAERTDLPAEVVAVLGSHRGWHKASGNVHSLHIAANGKQLVSACGASLHFWDLENLRRLKSASEKSADQLYILAASADAKKLVVVHRHGDIAESRDRSTFQVELWEIGDGVPKRTAILIKDGKLGEPQRLPGAFRGNKFLMLWGDENAISVRSWDVSGATVREEPATDLREIAPARDMRAACFADQGKTLALTVAVADTDKSRVILLDPTAPKHNVKELELPLPARVLDRNLALSDDRRWLVTRGLGQQLQVLDLTASPVKAVFTTTAALAHSSEMPSLTLDPAGRHLAFIGAQPAPAEPHVADPIWSLRYVNLTAAGPQEQVLQTGLRYWQISALQFTPDGKALAAGTWDGQLQVWDLKDGKAKLRYTPIGHESWVFTAAFTPDGKALLTGGRDRRLCLWDLAGDRPALAQVAEDRSRVFSLAPVPGGPMWAAAGFEPGGISLWKAEGGKLALAQQWLTQGEQLWQVAVAPNGQRLFSANGKEVLDRFGPDKEKGDAEGVGVWQLGEDKAILKNLLRDHKGGAIGVALSPDGKLLVSVGGRASYGEDGKRKEFGEALVWDVSGADPKLLQRIEGHAKVVYRATFAPDGKTLAIAGRGQTVHLYDVQGQKITARQALAGHDHPVIGLAFSPDSRLLLTTDFGGKLLLWNAAKGEGVRTWQFGDRVCDVVFAPDGRHFATANAWGTAYVWRVPAK
jgi:WD40 repeat protein